jgi:protein ImuA
LPFGIASIDCRLPGGGLPRVGVHELLAERGPAAGFAAALAGRRLRDGAALPGDAIPGEANSRAAILWIGCQTELYAPGLASFGIAPEQLILVQALHETEVLWAMEEGLRTPGLAAVIAELHGLDTTAGRRLQLAAEAGGGTGLVLRPPTARAAGAGAACSRWRVGAAPSRRGWTCWQLDLERCRGAEPASWIVEWNDATGDFALASEAGDRPAPAPSKPAERQRAGERPHRAVA